MLRQTQEASAVANPRAQCMHSTRRADDPVGRKSSESRVHQRRSGFAERSLATQQREALLTERQGKGLRERRCCKRLEGTQKDTGAGGTAGVLAGCHGKEALHTTQMRKSESMLRSAAQVWRERGSCSESQV